MKKRVLFVDRDGTILVEPPEDYQVDSLEKLEFVAGAISGLKSVSDWVRRLFPKRLFGLFIPR